MIDLVDTAPAVSVDTAEYVRLLGFPRGHVLSGRALELAQDARAWYAEHGRPWAYAREAEAVRVEPGVVKVEGIAFHSPRLERTLREAGAHGAMLVAVSAGPEIEREAHEAWLAERPDEYFFLEMFGSAVVEHLTTTIGAKLCGWADSEAMAVLPHYSPGYPEWDISEQARLFALLERDELPGTIEVLESGMLRPKKSLLAVFGLTRHVDRVRPLSGLVPCENCSFTPCQFRRAPYARAGVPVAVAETGGDLVVSAAPRYATSARALRRWADERLTITPRPDGAIDAVFRYDGSTCSNMGRTLAFEYHVTLGPRDEGFPIRTQACRPVSGDDGYQFMCEYVREGDAFVAAIERDAPLRGRPLMDVLSWQRPLLAPGCFCEPESRQHKWGLVLETIHYALTRPEGQRA
jgi:hypothetical protein